MKKLLPFLFLTLFLLTGCEKEEETALQITSARLQGKWVFVSEKYEYYDADNHKIHEFTVANPYTFTFIGQNVEIFNLHYTVNGTFSIQEINGKKYLTTIQSNNTAEVEITTLTDTEMTWYTHVSNYFYVEDGITKQAANCFSTVKLQKQP